MAELASPLGDAYSPGPHALRGGVPGVVLSEVSRGSIVQVAWFAGGEPAIVEALRSFAGLAIEAGSKAGVLADSRAAFGFAPGKLLIADDAEGLADSLYERIPASTGSVTDLSHGRVIFRISGPKAGWVLPKFFAIDFSVQAFPVGRGIATAHHDVFALIQRTSADQFDLYVFRSFARAFWTALCHASEEVGYEVR